MYYSQGSSALEVFVSSSLMFMLFSLAEQLFGWYYETVVQLYFTQQLTLPNEVAYRGLIKMSGLEMSTIKFIEDRLGCKIWNYLIFPRDLETLVLILHLPLIEKNYFVNNYCKYCYPVVYSEISKGGSRKRGALHDYY